MLDASPFLRPERAALVELLRDLDVAHWSRQTECPAWDVKGVALHIVGDDLSLLARQRDTAENGVLLFAMDHPGLSFLELLNGFNEQWVTASRFLSPRMATDLLELSGEWTEEFYCALDLMEPGEPVGFFGSQGEPSPWWQVVAREYAERWIHHTQIRRALDAPPVQDELAAPAIDSLVLGIGARNDELGSLEIGDQVWSFREGHATLRLDEQRAVEVLSRALSYEQTVEAMTGDDDLVASIADQTCQDYGTRRRGI